MISFIVQILVATIAWPFVFIYEAIEGIIEGLASYPIAIYRICRDNSCKSDEEQLADALREYSSSLRKGGW